MGIHRPLAAMILLALVPLACAEDEGLLDGDELDLLATLGGVPEVQADPTNAYAGNPMAEALGQTIYWDPALSKDGSLGCASCHQPSQGWSIDTARSFGSSGPGGPGGTEEAVLSAWHSPSVGNLGLVDYIFWDGRGDSLWMQAFAALTSPGVHRFDELELAQTIDARYGAEYEALFGPAPVDLDAIMPGTDPDSLDASTRLGLREMGINVGKAIGAYELKIVYRNSDFDRFLAGEGDLSPAAQRGAKLFVDPERGCISCHSGPALSDGWFHNVGLEQPPDQGMDTGALDGLPRLLASELNGAGPWSDDTSAGRVALDRAEAALADDPEALSGAFKTPGLRDVTLRPLFGHTGTVASLEDWIELYSTGGSGQNFPGVSEILPRDYTHEEVEALVAFLTALESEPLGDLERPN